MDHEIVQRLIRNYAEDEDQAWVWLRGMHELGYTLVGSAAFDLGFTLGSTAIVPVVKSGTVKWSASVGALTRDNALARVGDGTWLGFDDPLTVARWWETEQSNVPSFPHPVEQPNWNQAGVAMPLPPIQQPMQMPGVIPAAWHNGQPGMGIQGGMPPPPAPISPQYSDAFIDALTARGAPARPKPKVGL